MDRLALKEGRERKKATEQPIVKGMWAKQNISIERIGFFFASVSAKTTSDGLSYTQVELFHTNPE